MSKSKVCSNKNKTFMIDSNIIEKIIFKKKREFSKVTKNFFEIPPEEEDNHYENDYFDEENFIDSEDLFEYKRSISPRFSSVYSGHLKVLTGNNQLYFDYIKGELFAFQRKKGIEIKSRKIIFPPDLIRTSNFTDKSLLGNSSLRPKLNLFCSSYDSINGRKDFFSNEIYDFFQQLMEIESEDIVMGVEEEEDCRKNILGKISNNYLKSEFGCFNLKEISFLNLRKIPEKEIYFISGHQIPCFFCGKQILENIFINFLDFEEITFDKTLVSKENKFICLKTCIINLSKIDRMLRDSGEAKKGIAFIAGIKYFFKTSEFEEIMECL